jgi:hypothetical protein
MSEQDLQKLVDEKNAEMKAKTVGLMLKSIVDLPEDDPAKSLGVAKKLAQTALEM